jgi:hypothetical protein
VTNIVTPGFRQHMRNQGPFFCFIPGCPWPDTDLHRIVPGSEGGKYEDGNVIPLCPNHHRVAGRGDFSRDTLRRLVDQARR